MPIGRRLDGDLVQGALHRHARVGEQAREGVVGRGVAASSTSSSTRMLALTHERWSPARSVRLAPVSVPIGSTASPSRPPCSVTRAAARIRRQRTARFVGSDRD
jgi:hypothetical protein